MNILKNIFIIICMLVVLTISSGCEKKTTQNKITNDSSIDEIIDYSTKTYYDKKFKFSVDYPEKWETKVEATWEATNDQEASPDGGIVIFADENKDNQIRVFGQVGQINLQYSDFKRENFITTSGLSGDLLVRDLNGKKDMYLVLEDKLHGVHISVNQECFNKYEKEIMNILKSIEY